VTMPILDLQRRMRQLGEIRIGHVVATNNGKTRPAKLSKFRFTSPSESILAAVAAAYGGEVKGWTPANKGPDEFEVYTEANRLPVVIPPLAVTQWYELYQGSVCTRRCDGQTEQKSDRPCVCDPERRDCQLTTRLNVMLRDVPPIGYWLLTSLGYYAAVELPPIAELLARGGGNVPGWLSVEERRIVREKPDGGMETLRFMVPTLDIDLSPMQVLSGATGITAAVEATERPALESGKPTVETFIAAADACTTLEELTKVLEAASAAGFATSDEDPVRQHLVKRRAAIEVTGAVASAAAETDPDVVWQQIVAAAGDLGWTMSQLEAEYAKGNLGTMPDEASAGELAGFLEHLRGLVGSDAG
jgi:hypothetical protein